MKKLLYFLSACVFLFSCEDKVDISKKLSSGKVALVVDAFLNNLKEPQLVRLTSTQYYFDNSGPKMATAATVVLIDLNTQTSYPFIEGPVGEYYSALNGDSIIKLDHNYQLVINYNEQSYIAYSKVNRVVPVDAIKFEFFKDPDGTEVKGIYNAEFFAKDATGPGDRYWIRHYKNHKRRTEPQFIGLGYDASSFPNGITDGLDFILPLRQFYINEQEKEKQWVFKDTLTVEIYSITEEASNFLAQAVTQSSLGEGGPFAALFAAPPANIPTNIKNTNEAGSRAVGFFCTSAVSRAETIVPFAFPVIIPE